ncbi:MAG TPA: hypothetical protein VET66_09740 [Steroidobacteraceae bacterium]|nr:hypothetical protein [Steroidobacteraceae bacterium]
MRRARRLTLAAPPPDPFGERRRAALRARLQLLGGRFEFESDSARLMRIVRHAYASLAPQRLGRRVPRFRIRLALTPGTARRGRSGEPPPVRPLAGAQLLCGALDGGSFVSLAPRQRAALLVVSQDLMRHAYHVRYELLEFAVYVLAARAQALVPLHAACVGRRGEGVLLIGASGAGKSTLVLHCLLAGLDLLAEDSVLVRPAGLRASGVPSFLHLRPDSLRFLGRTARGGVRRRATLIRRRSGVTKLEIDLRGSRPFGAARGRLACGALKLGAVVFVSARHSADDALLVPLARPTVLARLAASQRYAATQPGWRQFRSRVARLPAYELRRGSHPRVAAAALAALLGPPRPAGQRRRIKMRK